MSHSTRGAWIETSYWSELTQVQTVALHEGCVDRNAKLTTNQAELSESHSTRGAWIETPNPRNVAVLIASHSTRGAWIETLTSIIPFHGSKVALHEGCVDRNDDMPFTVFLTVSRTPRGVRG